MKNGKISLTYSNPSITPIIEGFDELRSFLKRNPSSKIKIDIDIKLNNSPNRNIKVVEGDVRNICRSMLLSSVNNNFDGLGEVTISFNEGKIKPDETRYLRSHATFEDLREINEWVAFYGGKLFFSEMEEEYNRYFSFNKTAEELNISIYDGKMTYEELIEKGLFTRREFNMERKLVGDKYVISTEFLERKIEEARPEQKQTKWTLEQVITANEKIDFLAKEIRKNNLSPFEAVLYICAWSQINLRYTNDMIDDMEIGNTIVSAANLGKVRCVGFAEFVNAVLNAVNFKNLNLDNDMTNGILKAKKITCSINKSSTIQRNHCQSVIDIVDYKYDLFGKYLCDVKVINQVLENNLLLSSLIPYNDYYLLTLEQMKKAIKNYAIVPNLTNRDISNHYDTEQGEHMVDGIPYEEYKEKSLDMMESFRSKQGEPISYKKYKDAYSRVIPLLYPDLQRQDIRMINRFRKKTSIDSFLKYNQSEE